MKKEDFFTEPYTADIFFFPPWFGPKYGQADNVFKGLKILAIGNSHYCTNGNYDPGVGCNCNCKAFIEGLSIDGCSNCNLEFKLKNTKTIDCVSCFKRYKENQYGYERYMSTYTRFAAILNNGKLGKELEIWDSIAFYNFLQSGVPKNDAQGTSQEIIRSKGVFKEFLQLLSADKNDRLPDIIILWGEANVFNHIPKDENWSKEGDKTGYFTINGKEVKVLCIYHPSYRKIRYDKIIQDIKKFAPEVLIE